MRLPLFLTNFFRRLFPFFFPSLLGGLRLSNGAIVGLPGYSSHRNGRYQYFGPTNGASRKGKSNRLHMSRNTKNRARRRNKS